MTKPRGYWQDFDNLERELRAYLAEQGTPDRFPTSRELVRNGRSDLNSAINKHGGVSKVASRLGLNERALRRPNNYWDDPAAVERELLTFIAKHGQPGQMPTVQELEQAGEKSLVRYIQNQGGQFVVAQRLGLTARQVNHPPHYWEDFATLGRELYAFLAERGTPTTMPTGVEFQAAGRSDLYNAILWHGGQVAVAKRLGLLMASGYKTPGYWQDFANLEREIQEFVRDYGEPGHLPTQTELTRAGRTDIGHAIDSHGGYVLVAQRLGLRNAIPNAPKRRWKNFDILAEAVHGFIAQHGQPGIMPTEVELRRAGRADLASAVHRFGGFKAVARRLNLMPHQVWRTRWKDFDVLAQAIHEFVEQYGQPGIMPTKTELKQAGCAELGSAIHRFGGVEAVAQRLGLVPRGRGHKRNPVGQPDQS